MTWTPAMEARARKLVERQAQKRGANKARHYSFMRQHPRWAIYHHTEPGANELLGMSLEEIDRLRGDK
jgi:hypothetical protein